MSLRADTATRSAGTLDPNRTAVEPMARGWHADRSRTRQKRRHRRGSSGGLEIPDDPDLDDRTVLDEIERETASRDLPQPSPGSDLESEDEGFYESDSDYDHARARAEKKAELPKLQRGVYHPYRRLWASERKALPAKGVAHAGGWKDIDTMLGSYVQSDAATVFRVVENA